MTKSPILPSLDELKSQAKRLRIKLNADSNPVTHSQALELLAEQYGYKDWNTLHAASGNRATKPNLNIGDRVSGHYLGQAFQAKLLGIREYSQSQRRRLTLELDTPVDVVTFDSFSAFRSRITCVVDRDGRTKEKTSDGRPHLTLWT